MTSLEINQQEKAAALLRSTRHPLRKQAEKLVSDYLEDMNGNLEHEKTPEWFPTGKVILEGGVELQGHVLLQILTVASVRLQTLRDRLYNLDLVFDDDQVIELLACWGIRGGLNSPVLMIHMRNYKRRIGELPELAAAYLHAIREASAQSWRGKESDQKRFRSAISDLLGEAASGRLPDNSGEVWAERAIDDIGQMPVDWQRAWKLLIFFVETADGSKPSPVWLSKARELSANIGPEFTPTVARWISLVGVPPVETIERELVIRGRTEIRIETYNHFSDRNISILKGLAWCCIGSTEPETARALEKMTLGCMAKLPGVGPWAARAATAAVLALSESPDNPEAVPALARLKSKVTFRTMVGQIEKALDTVAVRQGVTKDDLEDLSVPTYGIDGDGVRRESFPADGGEYVAEMRLGPTGDVALSFLAPGGKPLKAAPAILKKGEYAETLKGLKADADAAGKTLTAQKTRFDGFYLSERSWRYADFVHRFIDHPLLVQLAGRLIWHFSERSQKGQGIYDRVADRFTDVDGNPLSWLTPETVVVLWHPIGFDPECVLRWRDRLAELQIVQPFKQAHREVYLLTDAELATHTYSNRFAGHLLKQHQMNSLAHARGWKNSLRLMVDDAYPPATRDLARWNLRAEYWIEGIGNDYGADTTVSGSYLYLATDQVRFYPLGSVTNSAYAYGGGYAPNRHENGIAVPSLPLTEIPALVFSEVMRDIDLFVGVASVGNDPAWQDGGAGDTVVQYNGYWRNYSFGDLSASAQTRAEVLAKLLPRLKIASRCEIAGRFLKVRGSLRTYKIHLGSGNILMEPNDQYLCIVPGRNTDANTSNLFLPFEGDARLSVILSKAFLLVEDSKITDPTITRQIQSG